MTYFKYSCHTTLKVAKFYRRVVTCVCGGSTSQLCKFLRFCKGVSFHSSKYITFKIGSLGKVHLI